MRKWVSRWNVCFYRRFWIIPRWSNADHPASADFQVDDNGEWWLVKLYRWWQLHLKFRFCSFACLYYYFGKYIVDYLCTSLVFVDLLVSILWLEFSLSFCKNALANSPASCVSQICKFRKLYINDSYRLFLLSFNTSFGFCSQFN